MYAWVQISSRCMLNCNDQNPLNMDPILFSFNSFIIQQESISQLDGKREICIHFLYLMCCIMQATIDATTETQKGENYKIRERKNRNLSYQD